MVLDMENNTEMKKSRERYNGQIKTLSPWRTINGNQPNGFEQI